MTDPQPRLDDHPDWVYLLREFYEIYRFLSSGGSQAIRTHQRAVREGISRVLRANPALAFEPPAQLPVTRHLRRALAEGKQERHAALIRAIETIQDRLIWRYGYEKVPKGLERKYAYAEFVGPTGPVVTEEVIIGVVLFAPGSTYPTHAHDGITESYVCLSGAVSENNYGVFGPGSLIYNAAGHHHRITTSAIEPSLLAYGWIGPRDRLASQKMVFSRPR